jgi:glucans biosynthesis protein
VQPLPGAAGWRLSYPLNHADRAHESIVLLGASHFRAPGQGQTYGLSARAVALDTAAGQREEFPAFTAFWFERPGPDARARHFDALLDGPRVSGA